MFQMSRLPTPVICVVIGEGGSGGALGIGVGDRVAMLEHAYYSVISPEGCAGILWKSHTFKEQAAEALKMTSKDLSRLGVVDAVIPEPLGGAHRDHHLMANRLKLYLRGRALASCRQADGATLGGALSEVPPHGRLPGGRPAQWAADAGRCPPLFHRLLLPSIQHPRIRARWAQETASE